ISATRQRPPLSRRLLATVSKDRTLARRLRGRRRAEPTVHHLSPRGLHVSGEPSCARRLSARTSGDKRHTKCQESGCEQGKGAFEARGVVLLQRAWSGGCLCGRRCHLEVAEGRRLGQLQGGEDLALTRRRERALGD